MAHICLVCCFGGYLQMQIAPASPSNQRINSHRFAIYLLSSVVQLYSNIQLQLVVVQLLDEG